MKDYLPAFVSVSDRRQEALRQMLQNSQGPITVAEFSQNLGASISTIERDVAALRSAGLKIESRRGRSGGLVLAKSSSLPADEIDPYSSRSFIGRTAELNRLLELQSAPDSAAIATAPKVNVAAISGEPGVGKSMFLDEFGRRCTAMGRQVLRSTCFDRLGSPPLHPWKQILQSAIGAQSDPVNSAESATNSPTEEWENIWNEISPDNAPDWQFDPHTERFRLFERYCAHLRASCRSGAVILFDDLHYGDDSTVDRLEHLTTSATSSNILVAFAYNNRAVSRHTPLQRLLGRLVSRPNFTRLQIETFTPVEIDQLIRSSITSPLPDEIRNTIHSRAEGNALFATELISLFGSRYRGSEFGQNHEDVRVRIPEGIRDSVSNRLDYCSVECGDMLTTISLLGASFSLAKIESIFADEQPSIASGPVVKNIDALLEEADRHGLLCPASSVGEYRFAHGMIRETLRDEISPTRYLQLSARIGIGLESYYGTDADSHAAELARHFVSAESITGSSKAAEYSILAGETCLAAFSFSEAEEHFREADSLRRDSLSDDLAWRAKLGLARAMSATLSRADKHRAVALLSDAVNHYINVNNLEAAARAALTEVVPISSAQGRPTDVCSMIERLMERVDDEFPLRGHLLAKYAQGLAIERNQLGEAEAAANTALAIGRQRGDRDLILKSDRALLGIAFYAANTSKIADLARSMIRRAGDDGDLDTELRCRFYLVSSLMSSSSLASSKRESKLFLERAELYGEINSLQQALGLATNVLLQEGSFEEALELAQRNVELDSRSEWASAAIYAVSSEVGQPLGSEQIRASVSFSRELPILTRVRNATAVMLGGLGEPDEPFLNSAESVANELACSVANSHRSHPSRMAAMRLQGLVAVAKDDRPKIDRLYKEISRTRQTVLLTDGVHRDRILGRMAASDHSLEPGRKHLMIAIDHAEKNGARSQLAHLWCDLAGHLIEHDKKIEAAQLVNKAMHLATALGMTTVVNQIATLGLADESSPADDRGLRFPGGLTGRENEVLSLLAGGMKNREIAVELVLSERTVQRHIANIYEKIDARNRSEATAFALNQSTRNTGPAPAK